MSDRPKALHTTRSFSRLESTTHGPLSRSRASTLQGPPVPPVPPVPNILQSQDVVLSPASEEKGSNGDIFAIKTEEDSADEDEDQLDAFEELPIEIRSLTERFLESLSTKAHPSPLTIDAVSELFQDFYSRAASHINTHIAALSSRLSRENSSPAPKKSSSATPPGSRKRGDSGASEQQMLTATEISDRKKARRLLEVKRTSLEEAVERVVCEKIYDKIYRHRSTDDEERDQKLRSRTAALSLVGIGLKELLVSPEDAKEEIKQKTSTEKEEEIREWLSSAREDIRRMDEDHYPLGKLRHLTAAHKSIVEALSKIFPASSSADEILPTLIYTLITSPAESINVISNINFIQRFRGSTRVDGEAAYCLVNLEAAISFLETVDLSSLRADETRTGPIGSHAGASKGEITPMQLGLSTAPDLGQSSADSDSRPPASPTTKSQRRLSNLLQAQTNRIEAASDAIREKIQDSADQTLDTINNTLENSFKFLFGRLREQQHAAVPGSPPPVLPKTLEDARKLVSTPPPHEDDNASVSATSSVLGHVEEHTDDGPTKQDLNSRMSEIFAGKKAIRDRSVDSTKSGGSGKHVAFTESKPPKMESSPSPTPPPTGNAAVESMRNLGNTLNPLNRLGGMNMLPRFGRTTSSSASTPAATPEPSKQLPALPTPPAPVPSPVEVAKQSKAVAALEALKNTTPPVKRFIETKDVKDLKIGDVEGLLKEYQRLAAALKQAVNTGA